MNRFLLVLGFAVAAVGLTAETITVATVNAWSGLTYQGLPGVGEYEDSITRSFRFDLLANGLVELRPDVIALQEANPLPRYAEQIAAMLPTYDVLSRVRQAGVRIGPVGLPSNLREGEVILAHPARMIEQGIARQLAGPGAGNVAAFQLGLGSHLFGARIRAGGRTVHVFTTRWTPSPQADRGRLVALIDGYAAGQTTGSELTSMVSRAVAGAERRRHEARETVAHINEVAGKQPVILMGSFFAPPTSEEIRILRAAGFVDIWDIAEPTPGFTFDATTNANIIRHGLAAHPEERTRYDYIFIRGEGLVPEQIRLILNTPTYGVHASAHYGLYARIRVEP